MAPKTAEPENDLAEAKRRLPLPDLMKRLGDEARARKSALCPFHQDSNPSFSVFQSADGGWLFKCHAGCGSGDAIDYLARRRGLSTKEAISAFLQMAGVKRAAARPVRPQASLNWDACVSAFTPAASHALCEWRGFSQDFVSWLHARRAIGLYQGKIAFPVHNADGSVVACHVVDRESRRWSYRPTGQGTHPLVFGDPRSAGHILAFESQWDALAVMDRLQWHVSDGLAGTAVVITRGAENGKLIANRCSPDSLVYAFAQNDTPRPDASTPAEKWLADIAANACCMTLRVVTPLPHKDANDWMRAGASSSELESAILGAKPVAVPDRAAQAEDENISDSIRRLAAELRNDIVQVLLDRTKYRQQKSRQIADLVVSTLEKTGQFYFHAEQKDFDSAMYFEKGSKRLMRVRSDSFKAWLSEWVDVNRADPIFQYIIAEIDTAALSGPHTRGIIPEAYWASRPGAIYLSNGNGRLLKITAAGMTVVDNGTDGVLFAPGRVMAPWKLTTPRDPFSTCSLFRDAQTTAPHGRDLLRLWLYSLPTNPRSKPPLCTSGEVGSGKTRLLTGFAELLGIPVVTAKVEDEQEANFWPSIDQGGIYTLDNADTRCRWLADALANAATDGCSQRRKLYTNSETVVLRARAWLGVTTATPTFANDAGLADRLIVVRMARRIEETSDSALTDEIVAARDSALSHMAVTLQAALADTSPTPSELNRRHPDFASFAVRIGRALGREAEAIAALKAAEVDKSAFCLENDAVATALLAHLREEGTFEGPAAELLPKLCSIDAELAERWTPKRLGKRIAALWPHLQKALGEAKRELDRKGTTRFSFKAAPAGCAGFQEANSIKLQ